MFEELSLYNDCIPVDRYQTILNLEMLFQRINYTDHEQRLVGVKGDDEVDQADKGQEVQIIYHEAMDAIFEVNLGIELNDDMGLTFTEEANILITIFDIEDVDNIDIVNQTLSSIDGLSNEEILADVLQAINAQAPQWYVEHLEYVPESFVSRLRNIGTHPDIMESEIEITEETKKEFLAFTEGKPTLMTQAVKQAGTLPIAWILVTQTLVSYQEAATPQTWAKELYAGLIAAHIPSHEREQKGSDLIETQWEDPMKAAKVRDAFIGFVQDQEAHHATDQA